jgi:hypothetical protein
LRQNPLYYKNLIDRGMNRSRLFTWTKTAEQVAAIYEDLARSIT